MMNGLGTVQGDYVLLQVKQNLEYDCHVLKLMFLDVKNVSFTYIGYNPAQLSILLVSAS